MYQTEIDHSMFQSGLQEQQDDKYFRESLDTVCCVAVSAGVATSVRAELQ